MDLGTHLFTWWRGQFIGEDEFGNRYYQDKKKNGRGIYRRWVIYKGDNEASKVPADWHGWLHHTNPEPPQPRKRYYWEKNHQRNLTGTRFAYRPKGWGINNATVKKSYEAWSPDAS
ncbi:NADH-ubiquinone oxidoreductase subunit NDUFA12 family protein [Candidatus Odyssella acanthamoebae]|uniref:NADH dehydrogenase n=1 Tax=Candidatus Odyssella acanthamoebae TaxID=91604 RepID=A0A077AXS7_9PROT|nr:NADH-ubiquinone oxidoreductase subunit NDUFA12 family protein [Candidatus Paracaedibacter acanthamoebae]AIK96809.1 hypothetical protein ID47_08815 [Candidatus Paracaedibacter acanthamoebae]